MVAVVAEDYNPNIMASAPSPPKQPKLHPIDIPATVQAAIDADTTAYGLADQDFLDRMGPGFIQARDTSIRDALNQLTSNPPEVTKAFTQQGLIQSLGAFGGGNNMAGIGGDASASRQQVASSVANQTLDKQDQDRAYVNQLLQMFPERGYGLSGADVANLSIANTGTLNANSQIGYNNAIAQNTANYNSQVQTAQTVSALGGIIASLGKISDIRLKSDIVYTGKILWYGIPEAEFTIFGSRGRGVIAQDVQKLMPRAVHEGADGYLRVNYDMIGAKEEWL